MAAKIEYVGIAQFGFQKALNLLREGHFVRRQIWKDYFTLRLQRAPGGDVIAMYNGELPNTTELYTADINATDWVQIENPEIVMEKFVGHVLYEGGYKDGSVMFLRKIAAEGYRISKVPP